MAGSHSTARSLQGAAGAVGEQERVLGQVLQDGRLDGVLVDALPGLRVAPAGAVGSRPRTATSSATCRCRWCGSGRRSGCRRRDPAALPAAGPGAAAGVAGAVSVAGALGAGLAAAAGGGVGGDDEGVPAAEVGGRVVGFGVVAQPHERGTPPPSRLAASSRRCRNISVSGTPRRSHASARRSRCGRVMASAPAMITAGAVRGAGGDVRRSARPRSGRRGSPQTRWGRWHRGSGRCSGRAGSASRRRRRRAGEHRVQADQVGGDLVAPSIAIAVSSGSRRPASARARSQPPTCVEDLRVDGVEHGPDPGLARGDDPPQQRMRSPAQVPQDVPGPVSGLVADLPEGLRARARMHTAATASRKASG